MSDPVLQTHLPQMPWTQPAMRRLPGIAPLREPWLQVDEVHAEQMALRDQLLAERREKVLAVRPEAEAAAAEMLALVLKELPSGYVRQGSVVQRPDGVQVDLRADTAMATACRLVQEDLCLMTRPEGCDEHILSAASLCFPSSWKLEEKIGRPLSLIHDPVERYTDDIARRVQRLFVAIRPEQPLWRQNEVLHGDPSLYMPIREQEGLEKRYLRSERQVLIRLPQTQAVLFSIHTSIVPLDALPSEARAAVVTLHEAT